MSDQNKKENPKCVDCHMDCFAYRMEKCTILLEENKDCHFYKTKFEYEMEIPHETRNI